MRYLFKVTLLPKKSEVYFRVQDFLCTQRDDENMLETVIVILTPKGAQPFKVLESVDVVAAMIEAATAYVPKTEEEATIYERQRTKVEAKPTDLPHGVVKLTI